MWHTERVFSNFFYFLQKGWRHRRSLAFYRRCARVQAKTLLDIDPTLLYRKGVRVLVLDFDGVLSAQDETAVRPALRPWLEKCIQIFGIGHLFILSNQPTAARIERLSHEMREIEFFLPQQIKPHPEGLLGIMAQTKATPVQLCMIDDRLTTGILAAIQVQTQAIWLTSPWTMYKKQPFREAYYSVIRQIEKVGLLFC